MRKSLSRLKEWINAHPENEQYFAQLYETWQNMLYLKPAVVNNDKAFNKFSATIPQQLNTAMQAGNLEQSCGCISVVWRITATLL
jgi:transmembrane sensor